MEILRKLSVFASGFESSRALEASHCNGSKRFGEGEVEGSCMKRSDGNICESGDYLKGVCA